MKVVIKSSAEKYFAPDSMNFTIKCVGIHTSDRSKSTEFMLENVKKVMNFVSKYFSPSVLVETSDISINEEYDYKSVEHPNECGYVEHETKKVFRDYRSIQTLKFSSEIDVKLAMRGIMELWSKDNINVRVYYSLRDTDSCQNQVLIDAMNNATKKAEVIAKSLKKSLVECELVDYVHTESNRNSTMTYSGADILCMDEVTTSDMAVVEEVAEYTKPESILIREEVVATYNVC